jgi:uncharacterized protein (TIGR00297 family)
MDAMLLYAQFFLGLLLGVLIAFLAWKAGSLSSSGAWAAALTGALIFGLGGLAWAGLLLAFFISSSALSRAFQNRKEDIQEKYSKGSRRDWAQVLANGSLGIVLVILHALLPDQAWPWVAYAGSMAAVNADTWATEVGVLSPIEPRLITWWKNGGKPVDKGTSGGITPLGTLAALAGAALIAGFAVALNIQSSSFFHMFIAVALGGLVGSLFDSFLGATVQAIYYCSTCAKETERTPRHNCGNETVYLRGWRWMNNDWVNFFCALAGAGVAVALV